MRIISLLVLSVLSIPYNAGESKTFYFDPRIVFERKVLLSEIADDISYIPLDNSIPLGIIYRYEFFDNHIFISAKDLGILVFNKNGKFLKKIGSIGRGPGEYKYFMNFAINESNHSVYVLDYNEVKVYSESGIYLRKIPLQKMEGSFTQINILNSKIFLSEFILAGKAKFNWIILDTLGNMIGQKQNSIPPFKSYSLIQGGTYTHDGSMNYFNCYNDTVFSISTDFKIEASLIFKPGNHRLPDKEMPAGKSLTDYFLPGSVFETDNFFILRYFYKSKAFALTDKGSKKSFVFYPDSNNTRGGITNDLDGGADFQPEGYFKNQGEEFLFSIMSPTVLKASVEDLKFKNSNQIYTEKRREFERLVKQLKPTDNPVLKLVRLK